MLEIEVKVPAVDHADLRRRMILVGAIEVGEESHQDIYLNHPCRDFGETDEALRLRSVNGRTLLTYKGPKIDRRSKTREEIEVPVEEPEKVISILRKLGFTEVATVRKRRSVYRCGDVTVALDRVEGLGDFVELEYEGDDLEKGMERINAVMYSLNLKGNERRSYLELLIGKTR